jgi:hypothetical protein
LKQLVILQRKHPDGTIEQAISHKELLRYLQEKEGQCRDLFQEQKRNNEIIGAFTARAIELSTDWEAYRKDPQNLLLFTNLSTDIQNLAAIVLALGGESGELE